MKVKQEVEDEEAEGNQCYVVDSDDEESMMSADGQQMPLNMQLALAGQNWSGAGGDASAMFGDMSQGSDMSQVSCGVKS